VALQERQEMNSQFSQVSSIMLAQSSFAGIADASGCWVQLLVMLKRVSFSPELLAYCPSSGILNIRKKRRFEKWICLCPQVRGGETYSVGSLRKS
jgi:hypothetical protein